MNDRFNRKGAQPVWKSHEKTSAEKEAWLRPFEEDEMNNPASVSLLSGDRKPQIRF